MNVGMVGLISPMFYKEFLSLQIPKAQKDTDDYLTVLEVNNFTGFHFYSSNRFSNQTES